MHVTVAPAGWIVGIIVGWTRMSSYFIFLVYMVLKLTGLAIVLEQQMELNTELGFKYSILLSTWYHIL